ncbi:uncharacterized protein F5147DRAFT_656008 [Suillus discolor]|uniref:Uncharacterized protein n=1 Tax=Suillus discolor TaxID=1912936 RepID=A0A9P7F048_9AGAM|nr:uncharacterized protein F5147DRAFT_656008 [Suillus discolor]KAG2098730.1 hypothetical protein F5147DRAFT_656008 [Suillus discolor]
MWGRGWTTEAVSAPPAQPGARPSSNLRIRRPGTLAGSDGSFMPSKASSLASTAVFATPLPETKLLRMMANLKLSRLSATNADVHKPDSRCNVTNTVQTGKSAGNVVDLKVDSSSGMIVYATYLITSGTGLDSHHSGHPKPFKYSIKPRSMKAVVLIEQNVNDYRCEDETYT